MDGTLVIVLIVVVWIFVLAPLVLGRNNKPIRKSGEAYDETRVLHQGGSEPVAARRRPKLTANDVHRYGSDDAADLEVVSVVDAVEDPAGDRVEDTVLIDDTKPNHFREFSAKNLSRDDQPETVVTVKTPAPKVATEEAPVAHAEPAALVEGEVVSEDPPAEVDANESEADTSESVAESVAHIAPERFTEWDEEPESVYPMDDSYLGVDDVAYSASNTTVVSLIDDADSAADSADSESSENLVDQADATDKDSSVNSSEAELAEEATDDEDANAELTEEELEFAKARRGRGGWDPESDETYKLDRYQRRQRTFIGLCVVLVLTVVLGIFVGGWAWTAPVIVVGLIVWYLVALRSLVRKERALRARRVRQLRRARLGVKSSDAQAPVPRELRRPGAIILEADDESPDFDHLPMTYGQFEETDGAEDSVPTVPTNSRRAG
ncbi:divisome protein SepX/GlpR [Corynebacterium sp. S7]